MYWFVTFFLIPVDSRYWPCVPGNAEVCEGLYILCDLCADDIRSDNKKMQFHIPHIVFWCSIPTHNHRFLHWVLIPRRMRFFQSRAFFLYKEIDQSVPALVHGWFPYAWLAMKERLADDDRFLSGFHMYRQYVHCHTRPASRRADWWKIVPDAWWQCRTADHCVIWSSAMLPYAICLHRDERSWNWNM